MNESATQFGILALAMGAGGALGTLFFGGLWWTVRQCIESSKPAFWLSVSFLVRANVALIGFYFVAGTHWQRWLACLLGFVVARGILGRIACRVERHAS